MRTRILCWTVLSLTGVLGCSESSDSTLTSSRASAGTTPVTTVQDESARPASQNSAPGLTASAAGAAASTIATGTAVPAPSAAPRAPTGASPTTIVAAGGAAAPTPVPPKAPAEKFDAVGTNPFVLTAHDPYSTFAADVDTASYDVFRRNTEHSMAVAKDSVRVEEFVNYFEYDYPAPEPSDEDPFRIHTALSQNPLGRDTLLMRVGIQARMPQPEQRKRANLVFLIDASGSMQSEDKLPLVQYLLTHSLDVLNADDSVAIVTYAGTASVELPPTPVAQKQQISDAINRLIASGSTNGAGGIQRAYQQAESAFLQDGINHVILCTDGDFNVGISDPNQLVALIKEKRTSGITLTALGFGLGNLNDAMMEKVSNAGNGMYSVITSRTQASRYAEDRMLRTFLHVAKDMKLQLEWNPEKVHAYRLIGYEDRDIADQDFRNDVVDAGEVGAGHRVTALYEIVLKGKEVPSVADAPAAEGGDAVDGEREVEPEDMVLIKVRYKQPGAAESDEAKEVATHFELTDAPAFADADKNLRYSAAVAGFAEILKQSPYAAYDKLDVLRAVFESQKNRDIERQEFLGLFDNAVTLLPKR